MDFSKFNDLVNLSELKNAIEEANESNQERVKVPFGDYEVAVTKLQVEECPFDGDYKGKPQLSVWFKVLAGEYKGQMIFMTKRLMGADAQKSGFVIKITNDFLNSLESGIPVTFGEGWNDYVDCVNAVFEAINGRAEYQLAYHETDKGFKDYQIIKRFV